MRAAWVVIGVALVLASGCAQQDWIDRTLVTVDVTGVWQGRATVTSGGVGSLDVVCILQQQGAKVTGEVTGEVKYPLTPASVQRTSPEGIQIEGKVSGDTFTFHEMSGPTLHAEFKVNGDEMTGYWARITTQTVTLRRQQ
jgi:hypothetical protein